MNASLLSAQANVLTQYQYRGEFLETMVKDRHRYGELYRMRVSIHIIHRYYNSSYRKLRQTCTFIVNGCKED